MLKSEKVALFDLTGKIVHLYWVPIKVHISNIHIVSKL